MDKISGFFVKKSHKVSMKDMVIQGADNKEIKRAYKRASNIAYQEQKIILDKAQLISR
jgi:hypothetical protein